LRMPTAARYFECILISVAVKGSEMREILSLATYLVFWFICDWIIGFESGLVSLVISLGAAIGVFVILAMRDRSFYDDDDE